MFNIKYYSSSSGSGHIYGNHQDPPHDSSLHINSIYSDTVISDHELVLKIFNETAFSNSIDSGILPPGVRHISSGLVIFERPPSMQMVQYINNSLDEMQTIDDTHMNDCDDEDCCGECTEYFELNPLEQHYIPVPWQLYIATYSTNLQSKYFTTSVRMYFMNSPLNHPNVKLYSPYIPNFFANGLLCNPMFDTYNEIDKYPKNISGVIQSAYDWIWNTGFNADLYECVAQTLANNTNDIVRSFPENRPLSSRLVNYFYQNLSNYTPDQVNSVEWVPPSFSSHFQSDKYNPEYYHFAFPQYLKSNGLVDQELNEDNKECFYDWVRSNIDTIHKSYADVISYIYSTDSNIKKNSQNVYLQDLDNFAQGIVNLNNSLV